jgi:hypothetical protein
MSLISKAFASDCGESFYSRERDARPDTVHATLIGLCGEFIMRLHITERRTAGAEMEALSDEQVRDVLLTLQPSGGRPHGEDVTRCGEQREAIQHWLVEGLRITKIRKLLARLGVSIGYPTVLAEGHQRATCWKRTKWANRNSIQINFNSGKSRWYRLGSSVMRRSARVKACDPMMKSASKRLGPSCAVFRRR